jgi:hypothetical protein
VAVGGWERHGVARQDLFYLFPDDRYDAHLSYEQERSRQQILRVLDSLIDNLGRDLDRHLTILRTLATSSALGREDFSVLRRAGSLNDAHEPRSRSQVRP